MSTFLSGKYDRTKVGFLRKFTPLRTAHRLHDIDLNALKEMGKELLLLDVDHTLVAWKTEEFSEEVISWLAKAKSMGFKMCILSNTRHPIRLNRIAKRLEIEAIRGKFKPNPQIYRQALESNNVKPENAIMIGDQIMTDIFGAGRAGIDSIWLNKMPGPEFFGTKINRQIEKLIRFLIQRAHTPDQK